MSYVTVDVKDIGKKYNIHQQRKKKQSLRDLFSGSVITSKEEVNLEDKEFWALRNVSFQLDDGDTMGIIGRNGAGKSTLLKILAQVIHPTTGSAIIRGKVASLLEVGTGFHPELTGRENVFFNGALIGMSKSEIASKYKRIVDFSEIGNFIDMPIKQYSSGMKIRLAFSVAAHLESDVMIIDEALAVGDVNFKAKSMERMKQAASTGRTVLFVTHSMNYVQDLCNRAMLLDHGKVKMIGETDEVVELYLGESRDDLATHWKSSSSTKPNPDVDVRELALRNNKQHIIKSREISYGDKVNVLLDVDVKRPSKSIGVGVSLFDESGRRIFRTIHADSKESPEIHKGINRLSVDIPTDFLRPGVYSIAADIEMDQKNWTVRPNATDARVGFHLKPPTEMIIFNPNREAMVKPWLNWNLEK